MGENPAQLLEDQKLDLKNNHIEANEFELLKKSRELAQISRSPLKNKYKKSTTLSYHSSLQKQ